jgi:type VI secretion system protein VasD
MSRSFPMLGVLAAAALSIAGCGSAPPKPVAVKAHIAASSDVNPNPQGRPSPVHVRVFQLKDDNAFLAADYWAIADKAEATLGPALLQVLERDLDAGAKDEVELKIDPAATVLGVVAEFADYRNPDAQWRTVVKTPHKSLMDIIRKDRIDITVEKNRVLVKVGD